MRAGSRVLAAALVLLALGVAVALLPGELADQSTDAAAARRLGQVDGVTLLTPIGEQRTRFLAFARSTVPSAASVRIVQAAGPPSPSDEGGRPGTPGVCGYQTSRLTYYWLVYALSPRPSTCDVTAEWTVYFGASPAALPAGARRYSFAPGYSVVRG
jgi:hypothetical protein